MNRNVRYRGVGWELEIVRSFTTRTSGDEKNDFKVGTKKFWHVKFCWLQTLNYKWLYRLHNKVPTKPAITFNLILNFHLVFDIPKVLLGLTRISYQAETGTGDSDPTQDQWYSSQENQNPSQQDFYQRQSVIRTGIGRHSGTPQILLLWLTHTTDNLVQDSFYRV